MTLSQRVQENAFHRRWLILAVLCFSLLVIVLDNSILNVAIPTLIDQLHATTSQVQWMVDSYTLVFAGLLLSMGALGDKYGRRGALQIGFLIFGLGSLASALVTTADQLIATRAFMGIGGALIMPATLSIITNVFPANERGKAIGVWAGTAGLGVALGPLTGGFLLEHFYWGSIFLVNLPIVVIGLLAGFFLIPTSKDPSAPRLDFPGAVLSIAGLSALLYGIIEAPSNGWTDSTIMAAFALGVVLIAAFVWWETRTDHPMLDVRFFKNPRFTAASSGITLLFFALFGSIFLLTQYLQFSLHFSPLEAGIRMLPFALTMMVVAPLSALVVSRIGTKITVTLGLSIVTVALVTLTGLNADSSYGSDVVWRFLLMGLGMALTMAPATDSVMGSLPLAKAGVGSAVNDTTRQVGGALGVAIIGSVLSSTYGSKISDFFANQSAKVPPNLRGQFSSARDVAHDSLGGAIGVANQLPKRGLPLPASIVDQVAADLSRVANQAFIDGMHAGVLVAALATGIGAIVALVWLPARARDENLAEQAAEYAAEHVADEGAPVKDGVDTTVPVLTDSPADIR
jgi:EmrB/QacA subfamily drug resistance transporter